MYELPSKGGLVSHTWLPFLGLHQELGDAQEHICVQHDCCPEPGSGSSCLPSRHLEAEGKIKSSISLLYSLLVCHCLIVSLNLIKVWGESLPCRGENRAVQIEGRSVSPCAEQNSHSAEKLLSLHRYVASSASCCL